MRRSIDMFLVIIITIAATISVFIVAPDTSFGRILTLPLVLVLPGYTLISALFPHPSFGIPERAVFSLGLSLVIVILGGLVLNLTPLGLRASSWSLLLSGIILSTSAITLFRRRGQNMSISVQSGAVGITFYQGLLVGMAVLVLGAAITMSVIGAKNQPYPGFTQLWLLPATGNHSKNTVRLGVNNLELSSTEYTLSLHVGGKVVKVWPSIVLDPDKKWEATYTLPQTGFVGTVKVEAELYLADAPTKMYRHVVLWLST